MPMHMPCASDAHAYAVPMPCPCRAHAVPMPCPCLREAAIVDACGRAPPSPPRAVPTTHVHRRRQRLQRCALATATASLAPTLALALALRPSLIFALDAALALALAAALAAALTTAHLDGGQAGRAGVPTLEGAR